MLTMIRVYVAEGLGVGVHLPHQQPRCEGGPLCANPSPHVLAPNVRVPITLTDGTHYGDLCCCQWQGDEIGESAMATLRLAAGMISRHIEPMVDRGRQRHQDEQTILNLINGEQYSVVFQPIFDLTHRRPAGFEALTRFKAEPVRGPDQWFAAADKVQMREALEIAVVGKALESLSQLPTNSYLSLNLSPSTLFHRDLMPLLSQYPLDRLMVEITEHDAIEDYDQVQDALGRVRDTGLRLAIDDTGAGYASFSHVLKLNPDVIKLDRSMVTDIDQRHDLQALAGAMASFAGKTGTALVAEGIETGAEHDALISLGVSHGQGYLLGRPLPLEQQAHCAEARIASALVTG
jgi:EAL domain-containing protein (putative c-di-GMP-specific phosphodiesterase class I)